MSNISCPYICDSVCELSILFHSSVCLSLYYFHNVLMIVMLQKILKSGVANLWFCSSLCLFCSSRSFEFSLDIESVCVFLPKKSWYPLWWRWIYSIFGKQVSLQNLFFHNMWPLSSLITLRIFHTLIYFGRFFITGWLALQTVIVFKNMTF